MTNAINKSPAKAVSLLWLGSVAGSACVLVSQILLARWLGPFSYGLFASSLATISIGTIIAVFGVPTFWLKAFGEEGWEATRWLEPSYRFLAVTCGSVTLCLLLYAYTLSSDSESYRSILLLMPVVVGQTCVAALASKFQLEERFTSLAVWSSMTHFLRLAAILLLVAAAPSMLTATLTAAVYGTISLMVGLLGLKYFRKMSRGDFKLRHHDIEKLTDSPKASPGLLSVGRESWPFALSGIFYSIYYQIDIVLLRYMSGEVVAASYVVAYLLVGATYLLPANLFQRYLMPSLHRWAQNDRNAMRTVLFKGSFYMLLAGTGVAALMYLVVPSALPLAFGEKYDASLDYFYILAICIPIRYAASSADAVLTSGSALTQKISITAVAAFLNLIANLQLIPIYGGVAAAWATVATEAIVLIGLLAVSIKRYR